MANIFVTGSTGFIGQRLVPLLLEQGHEVYALTRRPEGTEHPRLHYVHGELEKIALPTEIEAAYYLIHSLKSDVKNLAEEEEKIASQFVSLIVKTECRQIIFLSGIIEEESKLSPHLQSRLLVEKVLKSSRIATTILRSSIIIGSGSASFEIIKDLVENLPIMIAPRWVQSLCQPIALQDVLFYLTHALLDPHCYNHTFDIGGPDVMTFKQVLLEYADYRDLKRTIWDVPFLTPKLSSYWLLLVTSIKYSLCQYLVESMRQNSRKLNRAIDLVLPHECITYREALTRAVRPVEA